MTDDVENDLRTLLGRRAETVDDEAITADRVRDYADGRSRAPALAPLAAAAAVVAVAAGITLAAVGHSGSTTAPPGAPSPSIVHTTAPISPTATDDHGFGPVPQCPSTVLEVGTHNSVCAIGTAPNVPSGSVIIRTVGK